MTMKKAGFRSISGCVALVTGSSGVCGSRLVEMLLERGAKTVICFDIAPEPSKRFSAALAAGPGGQDIIICSGSAGDLTNYKAVEEAFAKVDKIDVVFHVGALVGPYFEPAQYHAVNVEGTRSILQCCQKFRVQKLVFASSPSTRFHGTSIPGLREDELTVPATFLVPYAKTKAQAEQDVNAACCNDLLVTTISPHQIYGPHDRLFFQNFVTAAGNGSLRIFGRGDNLISMCFVDNYCHGLMCGADALYKDSPVLKQFYVITDGTPVKVWRELNRAFVSLGLDDIREKIHLPTMLLYAIAYVCVLLGYILGRRFKLTPFAVRMMTIDRYFSLENAKRDLHFEPVVSFEQGWQLTIDWFREKWLPGFLVKSGAKTKIL